MIFTLNESAPKPKKIYHHLQHIIIYYLYDCEVCHAKTPIAADIDKCFDALAMPAKPTDELAHELARESA